MHTTTVNTLHGSAPDALIEQAIIVLAINSIQSYNYYICIILLQVYYLTCAGFSNNTSLPFLSTAAQNGIMHALSDQIFK